MVRRHYLAFILLPLLVLPVSSVYAQSSVGNDTVRTPGALTDQSPGWSAPDLSGLTPDAVQGPPTPANIYAIVGMDEHQLLQYVAAYRAHMASTWRSRLAVVSAVKMMDRAERASDGDAYRYYELAAARLWAEVSAQDTGFDATLGTILHKEQLQRYRKWKDQWVRATRMQQRIDASTAIADSAENPG
jgi:hypothetical protein